MMNASAPHGRDHTGPARKPYRAPAVERVELALEETLSAGCKLADTACTDPFPGESEAGS